MLDFKPCKDIFCNMEKNVIMDEMNRHKECKLKHLLAHKCLPFITQWKSKNADVLMKQLGSTHELLPLKFLNGILCTFIQQNYCSIFAEGVYDRHMSSTVWEVYSLLLLWHHGKLKHDPSWICYNFWEQECRILALFLEVCEKFAP